MLRTKQIPSAYSQTTSSEIIVLCYEFRKLRETYPRDYHSKRKLGVVCLITIVPLDEAITVVRK